MKAAVAMAILSSLAGGVKGYSYDEKMVLGLLPAYAQPPFNATRQLNMEVSCCSLGIPNDWSQENSQTGFVSTKIASMDPSVFEVGSNQTVVNDTGSVRVFLQGRRIAPSGLWNGGDCRTEVSETSAKDSFSAWVVEGVNRTLVSSQEFDENTASGLFAGEALAAQWPENNEIAFTFSGMPPGREVINESYSLETAYSVTHYHQVHHQTCYSGQCYEWNACEPYLTEPEDYVDEASDSQKVLVLRPPSVNQSFFQDGGAGRLRLNVETGNLSGWAFESAGGSAGGSGVQYGFEQTLPPYNISQIVALPNPIASITGFQVLRGRVSAYEANALLQGNFTGGSLTVASPFEQVAFGQGPTALPTELSLTPVDYGNGSQGLRISLSSRGTPLAGQVIEVSWAGEVDELKTGSGGWVVDWRNASGESIAQARYDSTGAYASNAATAAFNPPEGNLAWEQDALFFLGGVVLVAVGLAYSTGNNARAMFPWLGKAVVGGLALWVLATAVYSH